MPLEPQLNTLQSALTWNSLATSVPHSIAYHQLSFACLCITAFFLTFTYYLLSFVLFFFFQAEDGIRDLTVTGVQTCALPIFGAWRVIGLRHCIAQCSYFIALQRIGDAHLIQVGVASERQQTGVLILPAETSDRKSVV